MTIAEFMSRPQGDESDTDLDDDALLARIGVADNTAYTILLCRHKARVMAIAYRMVNNTGEAEDIAQDTFQRIWTHAKSWQSGRARFTTWLYRVVINLCIDRQRRPIWAALDEVFDPVDPSPGPNEQMAAKEIGTRVQAAIAALPVRQRAALTLVYYEGLSGRAAAESLGISEAAVESLLVRSRRTLRTTLADLRLP